MACSRLRRITILRACLLFITCVTGSKETPREGKDLQDEWFMHFVTRPDIKAPKFEVHIHDEEAISPGYWFIAPYQNINKRYQGKIWEGPYIYDGNGDLVWAGAPDLNYYNVHDFKVSTFNSTDTLTAIYPLNNAGLVYNSHYEIIKTVTWTSAWESANMHEFHVIENGKRLLATTREGWRELSVEESKTVGFEGRCKVRADGIEELDISSDPPRVLFKWVGIEHIPLEHSVQHRKQEKVNEECSGSWDIHHINSVDKFADGDYLVSIKVLNTICKVSHKDGSIIWRLGGPHSNFTVPHNVHFASQHIPRIIEESSTHLKLSIFDNAGGKLARGIVVKLDFHSMTSELVQEAAHPLEETLGSRGSTQLLANGNLFTCWANWARITEHDPNGKQLMFASFKREDQMPTYRGYKFQWVGQPSDPPNVYSASFALGRDRKRVVTTIFVSWNGATEVEQWKLYESNADDTQRMYINKTDRHGFETKIEYEGFAEYVVVEALDSTGRPIGCSRVVRTIPPTQGVADEKKPDDWSHPPQKTDFEDFDSEGIEPEEINPDAIDSEEYPSTDTGKSLIAQILTNPVSTYIAGFFTCAAMLAGIRIAKRSKGRSWQHWTSTKYRPLESKDDGFLLAEEENKVDDIELDHGIR